MKLILKVKDVPSSYEVKEGEFLGVKEFKCFLPCEENHNFPYLILHYEEKRRDYPSATIEQIDENTYLFRDSKIFKLNYIELDEYEVIDLICDLNKKLIFFNPRDGFPCEDFYLIKDFYGIMELE